MLPRGKSVLAGWAGLGWLGGRPALDGLEATDTAAAAAAALHSDASQDFRIPTLNTRRSVNITITVYTVTV